MKKRFLQSMKNNTLSVKKLMKNLILRTLQQLYAVSEIIILIWWVTPPQKLKIFNLSFSSVLKFLSCSNSSTCKIFTYAVIFLHWLYIDEFMSSTAFTYSYFFKLVFLLSECDRTLPFYAILNPICSQILHVRSI